MFFKTPAALSPPESRFFCQCPPSHSAVMPPSTDCAKRTMLGSCRSDLGEGVDECNCCEVEQFTVYFLYALGKVMSSSHLKGGSVFFHYQHFIWKRGREGIQTENREMSRFGRNKSQPCSAWIVIMKWGPPACNCAHGLWIPQLLDSS